MKWTIGRTEVGCPTWCARRHHTTDTQDDAVHVSGALQVRRNLVRLVTTADSATGEQDGPYVLLGQEKYTLHEAEVLIAVLTQLVDAARAATAPEVPRTRKPGP